MIEQNILIQEGINLLLTGMVIVFTFLGTINYFSQFIEAIILIINTGQ
jgi:Na+-transporting methylmalonyl-CoA/oxaloacetate decarboxylase gamma subunit